jgi:hypothetical protein
MNKWILFYCFISILLLNSCNVRSKHWSQRAVERIQTLVDSGYITAKYIQLWEMGFNGSTSFYEVYGTTGPIADKAEYPSRIIAYKGRYYSFIELDEPELSKAERHKITGVLSDTMSTSDMKYWILGISKDTDRCTLVKDTANYFYPIEYPQLWPFLSSGQPRNGLLLALIDYGIIVSDPQTFSSSRLKSSIAKLRGRILIKNYSEDTLYFSNKDESSFLVLNGKEKLKLVLSNSFPSKLLPNECHVLHYESVADSSFFSRLPNQKTLQALGRLLSDSTYCFLGDINKTKIRLLYNDLNRGHIVFDKSGKELQSIWNEGVYDKDERQYRYFTENPLPNPK